MCRILKTVDHEKTLALKINPGEALPPNHLPRFVLEIIAQLDLSSICEQCAPRGGNAYAPKIL